MVEHLNPNKKNGNNNKKVSLAVHCKFCKSENNTKEGFRSTKRRGKIQKFHCLDCGKYFTADMGFYHMRNSDAVITLSIDMYLSNLSSRKMRNQLKRHMETKISHVSVLDWVRRYILRVQRYLDTKKPLLSGKCYADETEIDCEKSNDIFWCSVDWDTRFIGATLYSPHSQNLLDATDFMKRIKAQGVPKYIQTDAGVFYNSAFRKVFGEGKRKHNLRTEHIVNNVHKTGKHNVRIETVFSKIKDRVYDFRSLKALRRAPILMPGIVLQHNYIENHTTTGALPCELAGIKLETGVNRWLGLIRLATYQSLKFICCYSGDTRFVH